MNTTKALFGTAIAMALGMVACWKFDPTHCASRDGDASCGTSQFCNACEAENHGCVDVQPSDACYVPGAQESSGSESSSASSTTLVVGTTAETTLLTSTGAVDSTSGSTGIVGCADNGDCTDASAPFCSSNGVCVSCEALEDPNAACAAVDGNTPVCAGGVCVQCTNEFLDACGGQTPVCGVDNVCTGCTEHFQCPQSACHLDGENVGACFDVADVVMVANGSELAAALGGLTPDARAVFVLSPGTYSVTADIGSSAEVAILSSGMTAPTLSGNGSQSVEVFGNAIVYLANMQVSNTDAGGAGISCSGTSVWIDDSTITGNSQLGLDVSGCNAYLRRTVIADNGGGGLDMSGGELRITTSAIGLNGNELSSSVGGLRVDGTIVDVTYSSLVGNEALDNTRGSVFCVGGVSGVIRNSIVIGAGDSISGCDDIMFDWSALDTAGFSGSNVDVGPVTPGWFVGLAANDFHLTASGQETFADIALWEPGDPLTDIDGDPIPMEQSSTPGYDQP